MRPRDPSFPSHARTALVTELWTLSLFDFIDRSGPAIPGELLDVVISSHPYGLPEFGDDLLQRFAGRYGSRGRKILFSLSVFPDPGMHLVRQPRHLGWPLKFGTRLLLSSA